MTVTLNEDIRQYRTMVSHFADTVQPPVDIRQHMFSVLRDCTPAEVSTEHIGWVLNAVSGSLLSMVGLAIDYGADPGNVVAPNTLGLLCSAAEAFITEAELAQLDAS